MTGFYRCSFEHALVGTWNAERRIVHLELRHGGTSDEDDSGDHVKGMRFSRCKAVFDRSVDTLNEALATMVMTMNQYNGKDDEHARKCTETASKHESHGPAFPKGVQPY